jgi:hypothetical protein
MLPGDLVHPTDEYNEHHARLQIGAMQKALDMCNCHCTKVTLFELREPAKDVIEGGFIKLGNARREFDCKTKKWTPPWSEESKKYWRSKQLAVPEGVTP